METTGSRWKKWGCVALLGFLGAHFTAQAFYNPTTGRWLSRDPIEERSGENLYTFLRNNAETEVDFLGLLGVYPMFHFEVPPGDMPVRDVPATTRTRMADSNWGRWEPCGTQCFQRVDMDLMLRIDYYFMAGYDLHEVNYGGHTVLEHEMAHGDIAIHSWGEPVQTAADAVQGKCVPIICAMYLENWFWAKYAYHLADSNLADEDWDISEFHLGGLDVYRRERARLQSALDETASRLRDAAVNKDFACGTP
jgi:hypothetical protein